MKIIVLLFLLLSPIKLFPQDLSITCDNDFLRILINNKYPVKLHFNLDDAPVELIWAPRWYDLVDAIKIINYCIKNKETKIMNMETFEYNKVVLPKKDILIYQKIINKMSFIEIEKTQMKHERMLDFYFFDNRKIKIGHIITSMDYEWIKLE